jgi:hypothetical protein
VPIRPDWPQRRLTAMHAILRAKFDQHPVLAEVLIETGDGRIDCSVASAYWSGGKEGRDWLGRLLELIRSEIAARRAAFLTWAAGVDHHIGRAWPAGPAENFQAPASFIALDGFRWDAPGCGPPVWPGRARRRPG